MEWPKIKDQYALEICILVFKALNNIIPECLYKFPTISSVINVTTRHSDELYTARYKTDIGSRQIRIRGPLLYNKLPGRIKETGSISTFKLNLKKMFLTES